MYQSDKKYSPKPSLEPVLSSLFAAQTSPCNRADSPFVHSTDPDSISPIRAGLNSPSLCPLLRGPTHWSSGGHSLRNLFLVQVTLTSSCLDIHNLRLLLQLPKAGLCLCFSLSPNPQVTPLRCQSNPTSPCLHLTATTSLVGLMSL